MIIVAVVIVIAVAVASILGDFPGIGSGTTKKIDNYKLTTSKVAVEDYGVVGSNALIKIRNNNNEDLIAESIEVDGVTCITQDLPTNLKIGQSFVVNCSNIQETNLETNVINIDWSDISRGASYSTIPQTPVDCIENGGQVYNGFCWYEGELGQACDVVCSTRGGNVGTCTEDSGHNSVCLLFHPTATDNDGPDANTGSPSSSARFGPQYYGSTNECRFRDEEDVAGVYNCGISAGYSGETRFCACNDGQP